MALLIATQYMENYGAHCWDGEGEVPQYWKCKGGTDYLITEVDVESSDMEVALVLDAVRERVEWDSPGSRSYILNYGVVPEDFSFGDWQDEFLTRIRNPRIP